MMLPESRYFVAGKVISCVRTGKNSSSGLGTKTLTSGEIPAVTEAKATGDNKGQGEGHEFQAK